MNTYQGGIPIASTRYAPYQRGAGFFSVMRRFLTPLAKTALPHVARAVGDVVSGQSIGNTFKKRGAAAGKDMLHTIAETVGGTPQPHKKYKRPAKSKKGMKSKRPRWL